MNEPLKSPFASVQENFIFKSLVDVFDRFEGDKIIIGRFNSIISTAKLAERQIIEIKKKFNDNIFEEDNFGDFLENMILGWLPNVTELKNEDFQKTTHEDALRDNLETIQYFAAGIEVSYADAVRDANVLQQDYQKILQNLNQLIEGFRTVMEYAGIQAKQDVPSDVMPKEDRDRTGTALVFRDFIILRDYGKAVKYIAELFESLKLALLSGKSYHTYS